MISPSPDSPASAAELSELASRARAVRRACLQSIATLGIGHVGGSMSVVEVLALLYFRHMRLDPADSKSPDRDFFVLSKGHAGPALYAALAEKGYLDRALLSTLNQGGTALPSHADRLRTPGVDMSTGSLGQGFSAACGIALGLRMDGPRPDGTLRRCWTIIGDGESDEGQVWEAAAFAAHYRLSQPRRLHGRQPLPDRRSHGSRDGSPGPCRQVVRLRLADLPRRTATTSEPWTAPSSRPALRIPRRTPRDAAGLP